MYYGIAIAVLAVSIALEASHIHGGIWRDEATSYFNATQPTFALVIERVGRSEINPPLFFLALHAWIAVFGGAVTALKMLPLIFSCGSLALVYTIALRARGRTCALIALALVGGNVLIGSYATELRMYAQASFLCLLATLLALNDCERKTTRTLIAVAMVTTLLLYTTYMGVFFIIALGAVCLIRSGDLRSRAIMLGATVVVPLLAAIPLVHFERAQAASNIVELHPTLRGRFEDFCYFIERVLPTVPYFKHHEYLLAVPLALFFAGGALFVTRLPLSRSDPRAAGIVRFTAGIWMLVAVGETLVGLSAPRYVVPVAYLGIVALAIALDLALSAWCRTAAVRAVALAFVVVGPLAIAAASAGGAWAQPKSALSGIAAAYPLATQTDLALLVAPDYAAQTAVFYEHGTQRIFGFVHWAHPDFFDIRGYDAPWAAPDAIETTMRRIAALKAHGTRHLGVVRIEPLREFDGSIAKNDVKTDALLARIAARYALERREPYAASLEAATFSLFKL